MTPLEIAAKAMRKEFMDHIVDHANPHWGPQKPDHLHSVMKRAGYADAEKAADFFALSAVRAVLLALAEAELQSSHTVITGPTGMRTNSLERVEIFRAMCRAIAEGK